MNKTKIDSTADFSAQYKHPNWQKKRLEVLEHDNYTCRRCGATETHLHVHHAQYFKECKVWQYHQSQLLTLCDACHEHIHDLINLHKEFVNYCFFDNYRKDDSWNFEEMCEVARRMVTEGKDSAFGKLLSVSLEIQDMEEE